MKRQFFKTILPIILLVVAVYIIGSGCSADPNDPTRHFNFWPDIDGDGFGDASISGVFYTVNDAPSNYVRDNTDCDDTEGSINPDAIEVADNFIDENCNGMLSVTLFVDSDGDGFGDPNNTEVVEMVVDQEIPNGFAEFDGDCNDSDAAINPIALEIESNGIDDNCDGDVDFFEIFADNDGDGYGAGPALAPPADGVHNNLDCNDDDANIHPYVFDVHDGIDNDCDGIIDED